MRLPPDPIDLSRVDEIDIGGRGGKEHLFSVILPKWRRVSAALCDYETEYQGKVIRLEVKI